MNESKQTPKPASPTPSPLPWTASDAPDGTGLPGWNITAANGYTVTSMMDATPAVKAINPINAALIVAAVNERDALVAALAEIAEKSCDHGPGFCARDFARTVLARIASGGAA